MPASLSEHTQFTDSAGKPLVAGKVYFGVQGADPTVSPITIYSDRDLTVTITNPQVLDSLGRTTNKVWIPGRYSMRVDDVNDSQIYQNLDNGELADKGITVLENVSGSNTILAEAGSTITSYEDLEQYTFRTALANTGSVTLNIDTVGAKSVLKDHDQQILPGEFEADQNVIVTYNLTDDVFEWVNQNNKTIAFYEGLDVVSAATTDIWSGSGNTKHLTGNTGPVTSLGTAPNVGAVRRVICDSDPTFTHSANLNLPGGIDFTAAAGDVLRVYADTTTQHDVTIIKANGLSAIGGKLINRWYNSYATYSSHTTEIPNDNTIPQNTEGEEILTVATGTLASATNRLRVRVIIPLISGSGVIHAMAALFRDSTADAVQAGAFTFNAAARYGPISFEYEVVAGATTATTFKLRVGGGGTLYVNGDNASRILGGIAAVTMIVEEIEP